MRMYCVCVCVQLCKLSTSDTNRKCRVHDCWTTQGARQTRKCDIVQIYRNVSRWVECYLTFIYAIIFLTGGKQASVVVFSLSVASLHEGMKVLSANSNTWRDYGRPSMMMHFDVVWLSIPRLQVTILSRMPLIVHALNGWTCPQGNILRKLQTEVLRIWSILKCLAAEVALCEQCYGNLSFCLLA